MSLLRIYEKNKFLYNIIKKLRERDNDFCISFVGINKKNKNNPKICNKCKKNIKKWVNNTNKKNEYIYFWFFVFPLIFLTICLIFNTFMVIS